MVEDGIEEINSDRGKNLLKARSNTHSCDFPFECKAVLCPAPALCLSFSCTLNSFCSVLVGVFVFISSTIAEVLEGRDCVLILFG